ncbi:Uncharacterised protein [Edwardsiella hoshinae]|uniref:Uncharacterized protein n=1 Tax=Edwardsiella hoshinae TaxID=93378 RepID=A0A376DK94_9GAMM|nr:Uncharacterised protein [Edwardsiella hoshinae]
MQRQPLRITHQLERLYLSGILTSEATTRGFNATYGHYGLRRWLASLNEL